MPDTTVQLPDGRTLLIPDGTTPDQMAQLRNKLATKYSNPVTGQGMEAAAGAKEQERVGQPLVQAADEHIANQAKLGERMNRASRSPTPFTNAISAINPIGTAKMLAGSKIGSYIGEKVSPEYGGPVGGLLGGLSSQLGEGYIQRPVRKALLDPVTGEPTVTPTSIAKRVLRTPEEAGQIQADQLESKMNDYQTARQKELADMEQLKEQDAQSRMNRGREQNTLDAVYRREGKAVPLSQSPYAPQHAAAADFAAGKPGPFSLVSSSPNIANEAFKPEVQSNPFGNASSSMNPTFNATLPKVSSAVSPRMETVERFGSPAPKRGTILDPSNIPADEVTYQSTPWNELKARATSGDKYAVDEVIRRGREAEIPGLASAVSKTTRPYPRVGRQ